VNSNQNIKDIMKLDIGTILELKDENKKFNIRFEDGKVLTMGAMHVVLENILLRPLGFYSDKIKIISNLSIMNFLDQNGFVSGKTINNMFTHHFEYLVKNYIQPLNTAETDIEKINRLFTEALFEVSSKLINSIQPYAMTYEITDKLEVLEDKEIKKVLDDLKDDPYDPSGIRVKNAHTLIEKSIRGMNGDNHFALTFNTSTIKTGQAVKMLGGVGLQSEVDGRIFKDPITSSYMDGMLTKYDKFVESRGQARALVAQDDAIRTSEWFSKDLQLMAMCTGRIEYNDCGNTEVFRMFIEPEVTEGEGQYCGDVSNMLGLRYKLKDTDKTFKIITNESKKEIEGKYIYVKDITRCKCKNNNFCVGCLGDIGYSLFPHVNIGMVSTVLMTHATTQGSLSVKHSQYISTTASMDLDMKTMTVFKQQNGNLVFKSDVFKHNKIELVIDQGQFTGFNEVMQRGAKEVDPVKFSRLQEIILRYYNKKGDVKEVLLNTKSTGKFGYFSTEFLETMKAANKVTMEEGQNYVINIDENYKGLSIIEYTIVEYKMLEFLNEIKAFISNLHGEDNINLIQKTYNMVNRKIKMPFNHICVIVQVMTIALSKKDYHPTRKGKRVVMPLRDVIFHRSISSSIDFGYYPALVIKAETYYPPRKPPAVPLDEVLLPKGDRYKPGKNFYDVSHIYK